MNVEPMPDQQSWQTWKKALGTAAVTVAMAVVGWLSDDTMSPEEWMLLISLVAGTALVTVVPNFPPGNGLMGALKAVCMFVAAAFGAAAMLISGGLTVAEVWEMVAAGLLALGFTVVPRNRADFRELGQLRR
jgi:hypothetical protein